MARGTTAGDGAPRRDAPPLRLFLLGGFRVERAGRAVPSSAWQRGTARALVKLLALTPGHRLHREQVLGLLWPEADPDSARNSLAKALHAARRALEPDLLPHCESAYLRLAGDLLMLDVAHVWIDVDDFERRAEAALAGVDVAVVEAALAAYGGEPLPEDRYADWAHPRCTVLAERYVDLLLRAAELLEQRGAIGAAVQRVRQALRQEPAREDAHRQLMRLYAQSGSRHQALRQYQLCRTALRDELGVEPEPVTELLYQHILTTPVAEESHTTEQHAAPAPRLPAVVQHARPTTLIGRERVLELLLEMLDRAGTGSGDTALIGGEAGVGKTRLVIEVAREAHRRGLLVLWGASYEQEGIVPYSPFIDALDGYVSGRPEAERTALAAAFPELRPLLPSLGEAGAPPSPHDSTPNDGSERGRLFAAITGLLRRLSAAQPLLLVLDDVHVADTASLQVLYHLARAARERRWLIVCTYREEDVAMGSAFQRLCVAATRANVCRRIDLRRLGRPDCDRLAQALLPDGRPEPALLERLFTLSLGNPLFLQELVRMMQERGILVLAEGCWRAREDETGVPRQVRELVETRVQGLGAEVRRTLALAAVAGKDCTFDLLRAVGDLADGPLLDVLDSALQARVLEEHDAGYAFRHPLFRAALYEHLSRRRRAHLHAAVAAALERQRPDDVEALAYHYCLGEDQDKAVLYLERAGDRARAIYANDASAGHYRALIERLERRGDACAAAGAREKLGAVLTVMARYDEALDVLERAAAPYQAAADAERLGATLARIGRVHAARGTPQEGIARLQPAVERLEACGRPHSLAALYVALAHLFFGSGCYDEQLAAARRAGELARASGDDYLLAEAEERGGTALLMGGLSEEGLRVLEQAITLTEASDNLAGLCHALTNMTVAYYHRGEFAQSAQYTARALDLAERRGDPADIAFMTANRGVLAFRRGDWAQARVDLETALALSRQIGAPSITAYPLFELARLRLAEGAEAEARGYLDESIALAEGSGDLQALRYAHAVLAEWELYQGKPSAARARLAPLLDPPEGTEAEADVTMLRPLLAQAELELGQVDAATRTLEGVAARAQATGNRLALLEALRVQALLATRQKRWRDARTVVDEALSLARSMPYPHAEARLLCIDGVAHAHRNVTRPALARFNDAQAIFQRLGAQRDVEHVACVIAALR